MITFSLYEIRKYIVFALDKLPSNCGELQVYIWTDSFLFTDGRVEEETQEDPNASVFQTCQLQLGSGNKKVPIDAAKVKPEQLAHFAVTHHPKHEHLLKPHSASAPNSPRLPRRAPLPITVTSSATLKVTNSGQQSRNGSTNARAPIRNRSKSPNPRR